MVEAVVAGLLIELALLLARATARWLQGEVLAGG